MLTQYRLLLSCESPLPPRAEWAYRLYSFLLQLSPQPFGERVHQDARTPVSQFLQVLDDKRLLWTFHLLGETSEAALAGLLDELECIRMDMHTELLVLDRRMRRIWDAEELLNQAKAGEPVQWLRFCTPTAFKSQKRYQKRPTTWLILQSLARKWSACFPEHPMLKHDESDLEDLARGLQIRSFQLRDRTYYLKGNPIPGFIGSIRFENRLEGEQYLRTNALLLFSEYSGIGIKTALGMGGVVPLPH